MRTADKTGTELAQRIKRVIKRIPRGTVATYAQIAALAGNHRSARQVARVLHSSSDKDRLPWHRVISSKGVISLPRRRGFEEQRRLLLAEGVEADGRGRIDLDRYQWNSARIRSRALDDFLRKLSVS